MGKVETIQDLIPDGLLSLSGSRSDKRRFESGISGLNSLLPYVSIPNRRREIDSTILQYSETLKTVKHNLGCVDLYDIACGTSKVGKQHGGFKQGYEIGSIEVAELTTSHIPTTTRHIADILASTLILSGEAYGEMQYSIDRMRVK